MSDPTDSSALARREGFRLSEPYPFDRLLVEQDRLLKSLLTDELLGRLRQQCAERGIPWISPSYYFGIFNLGMNRLSITTPEFAVEQCLAKGPDALVIAPSVARNLMTEYDTKLVALRKIQQAKVDASDLVDVNPVDLARAQQAYAAFMEADPIGVLATITDPTLQRECLRELVARAREDVLPQIQLASQPVMEAGKLILDMAFDMLGFQKDPESLPQTDRPLLSQ